MLGETLVTSWQMWAIFGIVTIAIALYCLERFTIETTSVAVLTTILAFFAFFGTGTDQALTTKDILSGFSDPALITIMALLVIGQGMFQTGALERPTLRINQLLETHPRRTLIAVFAFAFLVSMFMNNTPIVVMFIPIISAMALQLKGSASRFMMPLSFICVLGGMCTLIGSSTNLLVSGTLERLTGDGLNFFDPTKMGLILASIGALYLLIASPYLLPNRTADGPGLASEGVQFIAQIKITKGHPLLGIEPKAGLYPSLRSITVRTIIRGEENLLPPFEHAIRENDILVVAATRTSLSKLLSTHPEYLQGMLNIGDFSTTNIKRSDNSIMLGEVVVAPGSRLIGRSIQQVGFRDSTGCLVLGIQRRSSMLRKRMLDIRLEAGDTLLVFGYENDVASLRDNRDLVLLDWTTRELPDIRKSLIARLIFIVVVAAAASSLVPIVIAAVGGVLAMLATGCLNVRQSVRALDMKIFLLIGAAFAMGLAMERTGGALYIADSVVSTFLPLGSIAVLGALFIVIAIITNILSNSATALLFTPIAISISEQSEIALLPLLLTVIFAANCCFATPIAYQTNLLVMAPGRYRFVDFAKFGVPLIIVLWVSFIAIAPLMFNL